MATATIGAWLSAASTVATVYSAAQSGKSPKIQKPKEQADPNSLKNKRMKERSLAARYDSGSDASDLSGNNTLG